MGDSPDSEVLAAVLVRLSEHAGRLTDLEARMTDDRPVEGSYQPIATPRLWAMDDSAREAVVDRLRAWVEHVYRPGYGHLAAALGPCWHRHPLCLYTLDWLSELWSVLYLQPSRTAGTLAGQAEWQTRLLPAAADQMARETRRCPHGGHPAPGRHQDIHAERKAGR